MPKPLRKDHFRGKSWSVPPAGGGASSEFLVDEISGPDYMLSTHADVIWYPDSTNISNVSPITGENWWFNGRSGANPDWYQWVEGWESGNVGSIVAVSSYSVSAIRFSSPYRVPDYPGDPGSSSPGPTICSWRKYFNENTDEFGTGIGFTPITSCYIRYMVMIEPDVVTGFSSLGMKLHTLSARVDGTGLAAGEIIRATQWYAPPNATSTQLYRYDNSAQFGQEEGNVPGPGGGHLDVSSYLFISTYHCIEVFKKLNTASSASDGEYRIWLDNNLVFERTGFKWWSTEPANSTVEINHWGAQIFHGGTFPPHTEMHHRVWGHCVATRRIGAPKTWP
jgi:hypothetical protein